LLQSITELHNLTGIDRRKITKKLANLPSQTGHKGAKLFESSEALPLLYLDPEDAKLDPNKERARLTHHQANIAFIEEQQRAGVLVERDEVVAEVSGAIANCRARLLTLPTKLATMIVGRDSVNEVREVLESGVYDALTELHNQYVDNGTGGEVVETAAASNG
jgi:hypothetical protein